MTTFAADEKEICHSQFFLGSCGIVCNAVSIRAQFRAFGTTTFRKKNATTAIPPNTKSRISITILNIVLSVILE